MSTRDSRGRDLSPQPPRAVDGSAGLSLPPNVEQLPPQAPVIPQLPQPTGPLTAVPTPQSRQQPVIPPHLVAATPPTVPIVPASVAPSVPIVPQVPVAATGPIVPTVPQPVPAARQPTIAVQPRSESSPKPTKPVPAKQAVVASQPTQSANAADSDDEEMDLRQTIALCRQKIIDFVTQFAMPNAPPWMVSMLIHLAVFVVLALIWLPRAIESAFVLEVSYADELGEQLLDDTQFFEAIEPVEVDPALAFDAKEVEDPLASSALPEIKLDLFDAASEVQTPTVGVALSGREPGAKKAMLAAYGGTAETENAVELALDWLKRNQQSDGTWSLAGPYADGVAGTENPLAATAMALLAFQGAGNTHRSGKFKANVKKGMDALLKMQDRDGCFFTTQRVQSSHQLYSQAQATIAICELYGMTEDSALRDHAQRAIDYAGSIQADDGYGGGGWKYQPGSRADTSVTGWFVIALKSGEFGKLSVPSPVKDRISRFLDNVAATPGEGEPFVQGSRYLYQVGEKEARVSMTAEALLCRQYLGWERDDPRLLAGVRHVGEHPIDWNEPHVYYWYYATQVMHHMGGDDWDDWNGVMRKALPAAQIKTGRENGSWSPAGDQFGYTGGRLFMTCLCTYMLEVYYRHMPIYQH
ncbi:MAG: squalene--hopene cyclase [Planctomycetota bacterium]|nr:squalene--hopene cyclase [Planctomycetota bacterium]